MSETRKAPPRMVLEWDLSRSHRIADIDWPADLSRRDRFLQGEIDIMIKLPEDRVFRGELADIRAVRESEELYHLELRGHPQTLDGAYAEAKRRIEEWDLPSRNIDEWYAGVKSGDFRRDVEFASRRNDLSPRLSLELFHSYHPEKPWYISVAITW